MTDPNAQPSVWLPVAAGSVVRRSIIGLIRADPWAFTATIVLNGLAAAAGLVSPWLVGRLIDHLERGGSVSGVDRLAVALVGFALAQLVLVRFARWVGSRFGERTSARLREQFVDRALALPARVVEHAATGDLAARGTADVGRVSVILRDAVPDIILSVIQAVIIFVAVIIISPPLGLWGIVGLVVIGLAIGWYLRRAHPAYLAHSAVQSEVADLLSTTVQGSRTIELLSLQQRRLDASRMVTERGWAASLRTLGLRSALFPTVDIAAVVPVVGALVLGGLLYQNDQISLGTVIASVLYLRQLLVPLDSLLVWMEALPGSLASFARIEGLAENPPSPTAFLTPEPGATDGALVADDVRFAYATGPDVLHGVSLTIRPGERLAIVGASGAGKSTLGRLLAGIDPPRTGRISVADVPVADLAPEALRRQVVLVTQEHHVFSDSIRDNVSLAAPQVADEQLTRALASVGASWIQDLPDGLDTVLDDDHPIDSGQAQQLALARVIVADPHTVILDEATAMLNPTSARQTEKALAATLQGRTVIAIAHRLSTARDADRVAVMEDGRITELGTHDELVALGAAYAALWHSWHGDDHPDEDDSSGAIGGRIG